MKRWPVLAVCLVALVLGAFGARPASQPAAQNFLTVGNCFNLDKDSLNVLYVEAVDGLWVKVREKAPRVRWLNLNAVANVILIPCK